MKGLIRLLLLAAVLAAGFFGYQAYNEQRREKQEELELKKKELELKEEELALDKQKQQKKGKEDLSWTTDDGVGSSSNDNDVPMGNSTSKGASGTSGGLVSGKVNPASNPYLKMLPSQFSTKNIYVHISAYDPLIKMMSAAREDGIDLKVMSGFRSYDYQKGIWDRKWNSFSAGTDERTRIKQIMRYSSLPGISRHHWGTDVDFNSVSYDYWASANGQKISKWLHAHAAEYGFCLTYAGKKSGKRVGGYEDEPWHWSHIATAQRYQRQRENSMDEVVSGSINGRETLKTMIPELKKYVTSISSECQR